MSHPTLRRIVHTLLLAAGLLALTAPAGVGVAGPLSWIGGERVQGSGKIVKQSRELGHFQGLATNVSGNVEVRLGSTESVTIETDDNLLPLIDTVVENGTLRIRPARKNLSLDTRTMKIVVQARALERVSVAGSGSVEADELRGEHLQFDVGGSGSLTARKLETESVHVKLGGSGNLNLGGKAERLQVSVGGSGNVQAAQLAARSAVVTIGGSGQVTVSAANSLNASVAGSGDIGYYGDPKISKSMAGSGTIKRLGAAAQ